MIRIYLVLSVIAVTVATAFGQQDPVRTRNELMKANGENASILFRMVRGREKFDAAKVNTVFAQFADTAQKLPSLFPNNSKPRPPFGEYSASLKIWQNKSDFDAKVAAFAKTVAESRSKATTLDGLKATFGPLGQACDNCHELYRVKH
jgi:cytochrome c556